MVYITGDTHGDFIRVFEFAAKMGIGASDTIIILGDAGFNYDFGDGDRARKQSMNELGCTVFCIHGNHEERPFNIPSYTTREWNGGTVWFEPEYPNLLFAKDGEVFNLDGYSCLVTGGAYSVDKYYRLSRGWNWFPDEQPSNTIKNDVVKKLDQVGWNVDIVLSHTCPYSYEPIECFLPMIDQSKVDSGTEKWLDEIESKLHYKKWYCGHWHTVKKIDRLQFMFKDFDVLSTRNNN